LTKYSWGTILTVTGRGGFPFVSRVEEGEPHPVRVAILHTQAIACSRKVFTISE
jgi:hypothetical protein